MSGDWKDGGRVSSQWERRRGPGFQLSSLGVVLQQRDSRNSRAQYSVLPMLSASPKSKVILTAPMGGGAGEQQGPSSSHRGN